MPVSLPAASATKSASEMVMVQSALPSAVLATVDCLQSTVHVVFSAPVSTKRRTPPTFLPRLASALSAFPIAAKVSAEDMPARSGS